MEASTLMQIIFKKFNFLIIIYSSFSMILLAMNLQLLLHYMYSKQIKFEKM
jgi:hypothetical protein